MKKISYTIFLIMLVSLLQAQTKKISQATVEKVLNIPVFMYSYPTAEYEEKEEVTAIWSAIAVGLDEEVGIGEKTKELINTAKRKLRKGKVSEFDAMIINPDDFSGMLIKFSGEKDLKAEVRRVSGVPVYIYSYPTDDYEEVGEMTALLSALLGGSSLSDRVKEMIRKAKRKEKKGKVENFDAIIISPDDFTGILIKFK